MTAQATFGRDGAMFESLLGFVGQLSLVLWSLVILTVVMRFVGIRIYRRGAASTGLVEAAVPSAAVPTTTAAVDLVHPTTTAAVDLVHPAAGELTDAITHATFNQVPRRAEVPAAFAASVKAARHAPHNRRAAHVPALASNSTEA